MSACNNARRDVDCWDVPHTWLEVYGALCARGEPRPLGMSSDSALEASLKALLRNNEIGTRHLKMCVRDESFAASPYRCHKPAIPAFVSAFVRSFLRSRLLVAHFAQKCCTTQKFQNLPRVVQISAHLHRLVIVKMGDLPKAKPASRYPWRPLNWSCDENALGTWSRLYGHADEDESGCPRPAMSNMRHLKFAQHGVTQALNIRKHQVEWHSRSAVWSSRIC